MPTKEIKKKKIGLFSLSCCEGCECVIFEHPREFLQAVADVEIVEARLLEDADIKWEPWDVAFVEGSAITKENFEVLKKIRENAAIFVTLGNCSEFGGIHKMKNYRGKDKLAKELYKYPKTIDNSEIHDMADLVKVDYNIPGCPITAGEFLRIAYDLLSGRKPKIAERTVCYECQRRNFPCLLQKGEPCFGPITRGGCGAVCLASRMPCEACRGFYEGANFDSMFNIIDKQVGKKRREELLEIFGVKDQLEKIVAERKAVKAVKK
jgi:sulfhydrogenase subunit delta